MNRDHKQQAVAVLKDLANGSVSMVAMNYEGQTSEDMNALRTEVRGRGLQAKVVKNTLARKAFEDTPSAALSEHIVGPILLITSENEPGAGAKCLVDFFKKKEIDVKGMVVSGDFYPGTQLKQIATLPNRDQALSMLAASLQGPVVQVARCMQETYASLARALLALSEQKN